MTISNSLPTTYKAYLIDVEMMAVMEIQVRDDRFHWYELIGNGCELVATCGISYLPEPQYSKKMVTNDLLIDDEGLFREAKGAFMYDDWRTPIMGNGLIIGCDRDGNTCDVTCRIEEVAKGLFFIPSELANNIRERMG